MKIGDEEVGDMVPTVLRDREEDEPEGLVAFAWRASLQTAFEVLILLSAGW